jgi:hypothetical protein
MKTLLILFMPVALMGIISCKEAVEVAVNEEEIQAYMSDEETLKLAMKRTSRDTRRLAKALESKDWIEIEMWANELKQGIGVSCVNLYIKNHPGVSGEVLILSDRLYNASNRLILSCKKRDAEIADAQFGKMIKSCETCHEGYKKRDNGSGDR